MIPLKRVWQIILSIGTAVFFFFVMISLSPKSEWHTRLMEPINIWWNFWRIDQNWALFSPTIREINYHTTATMTFADGTRMVYELPRMDKLSIANRFRDEKWRKWASDSLPWEDFKEYWPDLARYLGNRYYNPTNKPVAMTLSLWWTYIPPMDSHVSQLNLPAHTNHDCIFEYRYQPEDFR